MEEFTLPSSLPFNDGDQINYMGSIKMDNNFILYGIKGVGLYFSNISHGNQYHKSYGIAGCDPIQISCIINMFVFILVAGKM